MKLKVELVWNNGIVDEGDNQYYPPEYYLVDANTGKWPCDIYFKTPEELEAYITVHYPNCERWMPPPALPEESAQLMALLGLYDGGLLDNPHIKRVVRNGLINQLYQSGYPDDIVARVRNVIEYLKQ